MVQSQCEALCADRIPDINNSCATIKTMVFIVTIFNFIVLPYHTPLLRAALLFYHFYLLQQVLVCWSWAHRLSTRINSKAARFLIDTGASKTVMDLNRIRNFVKHDDFRKNEYLSTGLGTNNMESQFTLVKKIVFGKITLHDYEMILLDLSHVNNSYQLLGKKPIDGVLGSDLLFKYKASIDYKTRILKLRT